MLQNQNLMLVLELTVNICFQINKNYIFQIYDLQSVRCFFYLCQYIAATVKTIEINNKKRCCQFAYLHCSYKFQIKFRRKIIQFCCMFLLLLSPPTPPHPLVFACCMHICSWLATFVDIINELQLGLLFLHLLLINQLKLWLFLLSFLLLASYKIIAISLQVYS